MSRTEIIAQIVGILEDVAEISPDEVTEDSVLMDDLDLSSMEILTIVADLEETFGIRIPEKELRSFVTISDLADYLSARVGLIYDRDTDPLQRISPAGCHVLLPGEKYLLPVPVRPERPGGPRPAAAGGGRRSGRRRLL